MDLIIKPTEACNFSCTFCSSSYLVDNKKDRLDLKYIFDFLKRFPKTNTIIVNGGDPLMMPVEYYWELVRHLEENNYQANISLTTNLWDFKKEWDREDKEKKWTELFRHPVVNVSTSFQYGGARRVSPEREFSEQDFIAISDLMLEKVGYRPAFISVVERENIHNAINNVRLAKSLGVDCKLNYANMSGSCDSPLPLSEVYNIYLDIWREGLAEHEWNTRQMVNRLVKTKTTTCPLNRNCDSGIRVIQPDGKYYSCGAFGDDLEYEIDFKQEVLEGKFFTPLENEVELNSLKMDCYSCEMFEICNGCKKHIKDLKQADIVEKHCGQMKEISNEIMELSFGGHNTVIMNDNYYQSAGFAIR